MNGATWIVRGRLGDHGVRREADDERHCREIIAEHRARARRYRVRVTFEYGFIYLGNYHRVGPR